MSIHKVLVYARCVDETTTTRFTDLTETVAEHRDGPAILYHPEIIGLPDGKLINFLNENEDLAVYASGRAFGRKSTFFQPAKKNMALTANGPKSRDTLPCSITPMFPY